MNPRMAKMSQSRKRSIGRASARRVSFTESIRFRNATKPKRTSKAMLIPRIVRRESPCSVRRSRAFCNSTFAISALLLHIPNHEDESELTHGDHEGHDDVEQSHDEAGSRLADERHDRHDDDEEEWERHHDRHEGFGEHPERLHILPHVQAVLLLELLRLHEEIRFQLASARGRRHDALEEVLELVGWRALGGLSD